MAAGNTLGKIRRELESYVGQVVKLRANRGRRKTFEKVGVLEKTYPSIFVVRVDENNYRQRLSFSYADVLTETVELSLCHNGQSKPLLAAK